MNPNHSSAIRPEPKRCYLPIDNQTANHDNTKKDH